MLPSFCLTTGQQNNQNQPTSSQRLAHTLAIVPWRRSYCPIYPKGCIKEREGRLRWALWSAPSYKAARNLPVWDVQRHTHLQAGTP